MLNISHSTFVKKVFVWISITDHQPFCAIPAPSRFYHVNVVLVVVNLMFMNVVSKDWVLWMRKNKTFFLFVRLSVVSSVLKREMISLFVLFSNLIHVFITTGSLKDKNKGI